MESETVQHARLPETEFIVAGIGINILACPEEAIKLSDISKKSVFVHVFREDVLEYLAKWYVLWQKKGFAPIQKAWLKQAHGVGQMLTARLAHSSIQGVFKSIDQTGALIMKDDTGKESIIHAGDVHFGE